MGINRKSQAHVFISYKREDAERAQQLRQALRAEKVNVWWDEELQTGDRWEESIDQALLTSEAIVVLWSKVSSKSDWVRHEASIGKIRKVLVHAQIDDSSIPGPFRSIQAVDLSDWNGDEKRPEFRSLLKAIAKIKHTRVSNRRSRSLIALIALFFSGGWLGAMLIMPPTGTRERAAIEEAFRQNRIEIPEKTDVLSLVQELSESLSKKAQTLESENVLLKRRIHSIEAEDSGSLVDNGRPALLEALDNEGIEYSEESDFASLVEALTLGFKNRIQLIESEASSLRRQASVQEERVNDLKAAYTSCSDSADTAATSLTNQCRERVQVLESQLKLHGSKTDQLSKAARPSIFFWWGEGRDFVRRCEEGGREIMIRSGLSTNSKQASNGDLHILGGVGNQAALAICGRDMKVVGLSVAGNDASEARQLAEVLAKQFFNRDD